MRTANVAVWRAARLLPVHVLSVLASAAPSDDAIITVEQPQCHHASVLAALPDAALAGCFESEAVRERERGRAALCAESAARAGRLEVRSGPVYSLPSGRSGGGAGRPLPKL